MRAVVDTDDSREQMREQVRASTVEDDAAGEGYGSEVNAG
jgi:hypothetical protein